MLSLHHRSASSSHRDSFNTTRLHDTYIYPASSEGKRTHHSRLAFSIVNVAANSGRSRKALPTVSLTHTNANASCINTSVFSSPTSFERDFYSPHRNMISFPASTSLPPFPSDTIVSESDYTAPLRVHMPDSYDGDVKMQGEPDHSSRIRLRTSHVETRRSRSPSRSSQCSFQPYPQPVKTSQRRKGGKKRSGHRRTKKDSVLSGDPQFLAMLHRSILCMATTYDTHETMMIDGEEEVFQLKIQDELLLLRLERCLHQSCPEDGSSSVQSSATQSHADHRALCISPLLEAMSGATPASSALTLSMPQLVASLILRHRDRSAVRSQSTLGLQPRPRSPLSRVVSLAM
jgi:hypothetical protein